MSLGPKELANQLKFNVQTLKLVFQTASFGNSTSWLSGVSSPASTLGINGDFYYQNTASTDTIWRKESGTWVVKATFTDPISLSAIASVDIDAGQPIYIKSDGEADLASLSSLPHGFASTSASATQSLNWVSSSEVNTPDWTAASGASDLVVGDYYYLHPSNVGEITNTKPTLPQDTVPIGIAIAEDTLVLRLGGGFPDVDETISSEKGDVTINNGNAGAITRCKAVYVNGSNSVDLARANAFSTKKVLGLAVNLSTNPALPALIRTNGILEASTAQWDAVTDDSGGLTPGAEYFLSPTTAGNLTTTKPGSGSGYYIAPIGVALSAVELSISIEPTILMSV